MTYPQFDDQRTWISWTGFETDLIFNYGIDLPGFASFPLLDTDEGRAHILRAYRDQIRSASQYGCGTCLESLTWMANPDRAAPLGFSASDLKRINKAAIDIMSEIETTELICISGQLGPRGDGYEAGTMTVEGSLSYHLPQVQALAEAGADIVSAFTLGSAEEAAGISRAAQLVDIPSTIAFTVETDGKLPDGMRLADAIDSVDQATSGATTRFLVNCAHPDHLKDALDGSAAMKRLGGIVANASRQSHAELDESEVLDDGDPIELGMQLAQIRKEYPWMNVFGGCCGTDMRHLDEIAKACTA